MDIDQYFASQRVEDEKNWVEKDKQKRIEGRRRFCLEVIGVALTMWGIRVFRKSSDEKMEKKINKL